jgi:hypothetical protein
VSEKEIQTENPYAASIVEDDDFHGEPALQLLLRMAKRVLFGGTLVLSVLLGPLGLLLAALNHDLAMGCGMLLFVLIFGGGSWFLLQDTAAPPPRLPHHD